jgi:hypothetical protein
MAYIEAPVYHTKIANLYVRRDHGMGADDDALADLDTRAQVSLRMYQGRERDVIGLLDVFDEPVTPVKEAIAIFIIVRGPEICDLDHWYVIIQQGYSSMQVIPLLFCGLNIVYDRLHPPPIIMDDVEDIIEIVPKAKY